MCKTTGAATTDYLVDLAATPPVAISDTDAIYLYGAFIAGIGSYGSPKEYEAHRVPGERGRKIAPFLPLYREKLRREEKPRR